MQSTRSSLALILGLAALAALPAAAQAQPEGLTYERWNNLPGQSLETLRHEGINLRNPDHTGTVTLAQSPVNIANNYGARLRGLLTAPATGDYTFFVSGDNNVELWLSHDPSGDANFDATAPWNRRLIAYHHLWSSLNQWDKFPTQKSHIIRLEEGQDYYIEALVKASGGGDHLSIGWHIADPNPNFTTHNFQSPVTATWQQQPDSTTTFSVLSGDMAGTADHASLHAREWTGNGEFILHLPTIQASHPFAKGGLMLRESDANGSRHAFICRAWHGQGVSFQRRTATNGTTALTHWDSRAWEWLRLVRSGDTITASVSIDGRSWLQIGSATYTDLAETLLVGPAASSYNSSGPVTGTFSPLEARPLVATEVIPGAHLTPFTPHAEDPLDRGLPDWWLDDYDLDPNEKFGANGPFGDPDGDGLDNFTEFQNGLDPLTPDSIPGGLIRELWSDLSGLQVSDLTHNRARFLGQPTARTHVPHIAEIVDINHMGARYRGTLTAPQTGWYRFWISGDNEAEFWFADGSVKLPADLSQPVHRTNNPAIIPTTNRYGKQLLAYIRDDRFDKHFTSAVDHFDQFPSQRSRAVYLTEGQTYYLEVLHKKSAGAGHVALAWQPPGSPREIIPSHVLSSEIRPADDPDDDNLPSAWEILYGLDPQNNGLTDINDGQYADPDGDGLTNLQELQFGTNPFSADTDNDGLSDYDEIFHYGTDPLVPNNIHTTYIADQPDPHQYDLAATTGGWTHNADGTLSAWDRRGEITYTFTTTEPGIHEIILTGSALGNTRPIERLPIVLTLNHSLLANRELISENGGTGTAKAITPLLAPGTHTLTILHDNYRADRRLQIHSIEIIRLGGDDLSESGLPDWAEQNSLDANTLTRIPATSRTSPLSIEGITQNLASTTLTYTPQGASEPTTLSLNQGLTPSINDSFFADIHLHPDGTPTALSASFLGGVLPATQYTSEWIPTNLFDFHQQALHIRQDDSLRLDAWSTQDPDQAAFHVFSGDQSFARYNQSNPPDATGLVSGGWGNYRGFSIRFDDPALASDPEQPAAAPLLLQQLTIRRSGTHGTAPGDPANAILKIYTSQTPGQQTWVADSTNTQDVRGGISETNLTFTFDNLQLDPTTKYHFYFANTPGDLPNNQITWTNGRLRVTNNSAHTYTSGNLINANWGNQDTAWRPLIAASFATPLANATGATTHTSGSPFVASFDTPGTHTLIATHGGQSSTTTLHVHAADLGPAHSVNAYSPRTWVPPLLGPTHLLEADDHLTIAETTESPLPLGEGQGEGAQHTPRTFLAAVHQPGHLHTIARLPHDVDGAPGAILARGTIHAFYLAYLDQTHDARVIHRYDDGTYLMAGSLIAINLPPDILIRLTTYFQGTLFHNGANTLWLDHTHFDPNGISNIYFEWHGTGAPRLCNFLNVFTTTPE